MHSRGDPKTMNAHCSYRDLIADMASEVNQSIAISHLPNFILCGDPGLGFAKTFDQNLHILRHLQIFKSKLNGIPVRI
jgi:dihydropteroate synthase